MSLGAPRPRLSQLAAQLVIADKQHVLGFRVSTARMFGFVAQRSRQRTLTPLGVRVCDPLQENAAKVEAFLNMPSTRQVFEKFKGATLPPNSGLENEMIPWA